ncbi:50S ribosomal protein L13 [bacterium]|nr:50S ribosomal protein L13 [bacterium]MCI0565712.1 50S ribosomal protein L13 [bacterium]MCI0679979.1 50S ribosomal protein L13 [bacterium]
MNASYTIDAEGRTMGRVATEAARFLMGKQSIEFTRHKNPALKVFVINTDKMLITGKRAHKKEYIRYTGHPGGQRKETLERLIARRGREEALRRAVYGMLPGNKLRSHMMKNLEINL